MKQLSRILLILMCSISHFVAADSSIDEAKHLYQTAESYFWFGMEDEGDMKAFSKGRNYLLKAEQELQKHPESAIKSNLQTQINELREELIFQEDIAHDTLMGVFPLLRFMVPSLFSDHLQLGTYDLIDDAEVTATTVAGTKLLEKLEEKISSRAQIGVMVSSDPFNAALENELIYIFNKSNRYFLHTRSELSGVLNSETFQNFYNGLVDNKSSQTIMNSLGIDDFVLIKIDQNVSGELDYFFTLNAKVYARGSNNIIDDLSVMGFAHDRTHLLYKVILQTLLTMLVVILLASILKQYHHLEKYIGHISIIGAVIAFLVGRFIPPIMMLVLSPWKPVAENLAIVSFWWVIAIWLTIFMVPVLIGYFSLKQLPKLSNIFDLSGFAAISFIGSCSYVSLAWTLYFNDTFYVGYLIFCLSLLFVGSVSGAALDVNRKKIPFSMSIIPILVLTGFGFVYIHAEMDLLLIVLVIGLITTLLVSIKVIKVETDDLQKKDKSYDSENIIAQKNGDSTKIIDSIKMAELIQKPKFTESELIKDFKNHFVNNNKSLLWIYGPSGSGKSRLAREIIASYCQFLKKKSKDRLIFDVECIESETDIPGTVISELFAEQLSVGFDNADAENSEQHSLLSFAIETLVPFASLISDVYSRQEVVKPEEVAINIHHQLNVKCKGKQVILFIDNYQWIDGFSREILKRLVELSNDDHRDLLVIFSCRRAPDNNEQITWQDLTIHEMEEYDIKFITELLYSMNIHQDTATGLYNLYEGNTKEQGTIGSVLTSLNLALKRNKLIYDGSSWKVNKEDIDDFSDLNNEQQNKIIEVFNDPEVKTVLSCAACFGINFRVTWLMNSLDKSRLEIISMLDEISFSHGIVKDILNKDDWYSFRSKAIFNVVKTVVGLNTKQVHQTSQVVKELHGLAGTAMEKDDSKFLDTFKIADHFILAGLEYRTKAFKYACRCVSNYMKMLEYDKASNYLAKAKMLVKTKQEELEYSECEIIKDCEESHSRYDGELAKKAAAKALEYLKKGQNDNAGLLLILARTFFEARLFDDCVTLCQRIYDEHQDEPKLKAEAMQFMGLSNLRQEKPDKGFELLNNALSLLETNTDDDAVFLRSRIRNSLAGQLKYVDAIKNNQEIIKQYGLSIKEKNSLQPIDINGLAMSHTGLGDTLLINGDYNGAIENLEIALDLDIELKAEQPERNVLLLLLYAYMKTNNQSKFEELIESIFNVVNSIIDLPDYWLKELSRVINESAAFNKKDTLISMIEKRLTAK